MDTDFLVLHTAEQSSSPMVPCAIRLKAPENVERIPTHIILLIDISESMRDERKLEHVKSCSSLIVNFLNASDTISLITFGETAELHLKQVPADETHKDAIRAKIQSLQVDGCTNLSAGLGYIHEVCSDTTQKAGLLLLTDGHANRGVSTEASLRTIVSGLHTTFPHLSIHCVAYGHDHNENLLRGITEDVQGSYNVVNSIEDTAFAFGETLGGLMSCAFQNVSITIPAGSVIHGPYKHTTTGGKCVLQIGDVFSGTKPLVLVDIPRNTYTDSTEPLIQISGMELTQFTPFTIYPIPQTIHTRELDVELTRLRYQCADILTSLKTVGRFQIDAVQAIEQQIHAFQTAVSDTFLDGHPVTTLLREEVPTLRMMLRNIQYGEMSHDAQVLATQHITSIALGRGFSSPTGASLTRHRAAPRRMNAQSVMSDGSEDENPQEIHEVSAPFQNAIQSQFANLMRTQSQTPYS